MEVFFDGGCPLCRREIDMIRRWDTSENILFTDISSTTFDAVAQTGLALNTLMREIHARILSTSESNVTPTTNWMIGVDVFREMYQRVGFKNAVGLSRLPGIRHVLSLGYRIFAYFRYRAATTRMSRSKLCDERCTLPTESLNVSRTDGVSN